MLTVTTTHKAQSTMQSVDPAHISLMATRLIRALSRLQDLHPDMTILQAMFFLQVAAEPGINQRRAYDAVGTNDSSASRILAMLSDIGGRTVPALDLVKVTVNPNDRRERLLELTSKGKRLMSDIIADVEATRRKDKAHQ